MVHAGLPGYGGAPVISRAFNFLLLLPLLFAATVRAQMPDLKPLLGTGTLPSAGNPDQFVFVAAGDNRPCKESQPQGEAVRQIYGAIQELKPAFVIWTGDTVFGKDPDNPTRVAAEYAEFLPIAQSGGVPVFNAPGNHEMDDQNNCPSKVMKQLYLDKAGQDHPYGAFNYGNSRFIALDSDDDPALADCACPKSKSDKAAFPGYISDKQMQLLKDDLKANQNMAHIFIFMHRPLAAYDKDDQLCKFNVKELQDLFSKYTNISYVLAGHEHLYFNAQSKRAFAAPPSRTDPGRPPYYLVSGGAGAPLNKAGFYHYLIFTVDHNNITAKVVYVNAPDPCE